MSDYGKQRMLGNVLVALQLGLIVLLAWLGLPSFLSGEAPTGAWATAGAGAFVGIWALSTNRPGNFNIRPVPRAGAQLIQQGPYRWIRHPMYSCVALCGAAGAWAASGKGAAWATWGGWVWLLTAGLLAVLWTKAVLEERWMALQHPDYPAYRAATKRFIPGLL